ncbi:MAG: MFS transporter, partial [Pseudomonadota bacterium]|nr:MFS transporter [Pseudomonadota bacterium]
MQTDKNEAADIPAQREAILHQVPRHADLKDDEASDRTLVHVRSAIRRALSICRPRRIGKLQGCNDIERSSASRRAWFVLLCCLAPATLIMGMDRALITVTAPVIQSYYKLSLTQLGIVFAVFSWAYAAMQIPSALIVQRIGPKAALLMAVLLWSAMTFATPFAGSFAALLITRALLGIGQSADWPAAIVGIDRLFPGANRPAA